MKQKIFIIGFFLIGLDVFTQAQTSEQKFNKMVSLNPNADRDLKILADYTQVLVVEGNQIKARSFIAPDALGHGPGPKDSATVDEEFKKWAQYYTYQLDRKNEYVAMTWRVLEGIYK